MTQICELNRIFGSLIARVLVIILGDEQYQLSSKLRA